MHRKRIKCDKIFYLLLTAFIVCFVLSESQLNEMGAFGSLLKVVKLVIITLIIILALVKNRTAKKNILITTLVLIFVLTFNLVFNDGGLSIIPIIMLAWAAKNYSLEKVFYISFYALLLTTLFVILCSAVGLLRDEVSLLVRGREDTFFAGIYYRHNMGFLVHNQVAIYLFALYLLFIMIRKDNIRYYESAIVLFLNYLVLVFFGSRIVFVLIPITCVGYYFVRIVEKKHKRKQLLSKISVVVFPSCCIFSFITAYNYSSHSKFYRMLDLLFSNRLRLAKEALTYYGIHLTGSGQNAASYNSTLLVDNTVDNGYISFFIQNGLIVGLLLVGIWTYITYLAVKNGDRYLILVLVMIAVENIINPHLGSYLFVPFLCIFVNKNDPFIMTKMRFLNVMNKRTKRKHGHIRLKES